MWNEFLHSNDTKWRLARTIVQGIIGVFVSNIDLIVGSFNIDPVFKPAITALVMSILSPIMSELGKER
jgi:hypothetical protein